MTILLVVSLLMNGIAIFSIIILYTRQNRLFEVEKKQENVLKEMEELISSCLFEMKEENEAFIRRFQQINKQETGSSGPEKANPTPQQPSEEKDYQNIGLNDWGEKAENVIKKQAVKLYQNTPGSKIDDKLSLGKDLEEKQDSTNQESLPTSQEDIYRNLLINQVKLLQAQGLAIEDIAKKLNKGKTEIELLLKFS